MGNTVMETGDPSSCDEGSSEQPDRKTELDKAGMKTDQGARTRPSILTSTDSTQGIHSQS